MLFIDAIATNRIRFSALLETAHYRVTVAASPNDVVDDICVFDIVVLGLPDDKPGSAVASIQTKSPLSAPPILCLDRRHSMLRRLISLRAGARDVLPRKSPDNLLLSRIRSIIRDSDAERECERRQGAASIFGFAEAKSDFLMPARIVCIGEFADLPDQLSSLLPHRVELLKAAELLANDDDPEVPDVVVVGIDGSNTDLVNLLPELRDRSHLRKAPVLVTYPVDRPDIASMALALGANEISVNVAGLEEFELRINGLLERKRMREALQLSDENSHRLAVTDQLTGLFNRRYAEVYLEDLMSKSAEKGAEFCLIMIDLDHFKNVNDRYGHASGDYVLREVAQRLKDSLRACDLIARLGGEEFLVALPETSVEEAAQLAERLRLSVSLRPIFLKTGRKLTVTASVGVAKGLAQSASMQRRTGTFDVTPGVMPFAIASVFDAADAALYLAKEGGRNKVVISDGSTT